MAVSGRHIFQIEEEKFLDLRKPIDVIETLLWLSGDESSFIYKNHHILHYSKDEQEIESIENFGFIRLEVNNFFKLLLNSNPSENLFYRHFQSTSVSDNVKSIQLNYLLHGLEKWIYHNWHIEDAFIYEFLLKEKIFDTDGTFRTTPENCLAYFINKNLKGVYDFIWDFLKPYIDEKKYQFDYFYSNKPKPAKLYSDGDLEAPDFFKEKNTYKCFRNYAEIPYSSARKFFGYAFQRMKNEKLIHEISHMEFASFLKEKQFISDDEHSEIVIAYQFDTLAKSYSKSRETAYNISFSK